jgi:dCTP deaminase
MGLKPDHWIRTMAREQRMIEPFEEKQVRNGAISYGVSSYGYDIRVADEFKIFTNVYSAVVDPKNFDPKSMVDYKGDVCVIPPNSFALARTVEYFRIPRKVLTVCLGKSTYARCFRGDTRVALVDGTAPTLEDMARRAEAGEMFWGYSLGQHGQVLVTLLEAPRYIGRDALLEVTLDSGAIVRCTPDHPIVMRDGQMLPAADLRPGSRLMPLYRQRRRGYELVYQPVSGYLLPTHRLADDWNLRHGMYSDQPGTHRHHLDGNRENNRPWNLTRMEASEHIRYHNQENYGVDCDPEEHGAAISAALSRRSEDPAWRERFSQAQRERALQFWTSDTYAEMRAQVLEERRHPSEDTRLAHRVAMLKRYRDPQERQRQSDLMQAAWQKDDGQRRARQAAIARQINWRGDTTAEVLRAALDEAGSLRGAARLLNCDRSVFRRFPGIIDAFRGTAAADNHRVTHIRELPGDHDVYCLTVPEAGNFALEAGVFVSNCGIIVNVTPFEPEWEGFVTLEISNTTPLPARIYSNEGIAQVLFFEADEECEISYADKKGKYQKQQSIMLPKL